MYFAELQKKAEEILQSLGNKLSAINSPEPLLRPVPPYISDVITATELLANKKYVLNIGKRTFNCGISGETQLRTAAEKGDIYSKIVWGGVNLRKKNYKIGLEQFAQLHEWNIPDDLKNKLLKNFLYPAYLEYGKRCYERSLSEKSSEYLRKEAISCLSKVSTLPEAADMLAECYGGVDSWSTAQAFYEIGAAGGIANSYYSIGYYYHQRDGAPGKAIEWYKKAVAKGHLKSEYFLAECFIATGKYHEATEIFRRLAEKRFMSSPERYIECVERYNLSKGEFYYSIKGLRGDAPEELYQSGLQFEKGDRVAIDFVKAMQFFLRAAEKGHELVQYKLATCYETGKYIEKNIAQAYKWYKRCADQGNAEAAYKVAIVYEWVKYHEKAAHWYEQAANKGYKGALYGQARMLANLKQHQKAHALFMVSIAKKEYVTDCHFFLGKLYANGWGVIQDSVKAIEHFKEAGLSLHVCYTLIGTKGEPAFLYNIGVEYDSGKGVPVNHAKAVQYYLKAAEAGHVLAQYQMGTIYESGAGAEKDYAMAYKWYEKAAMQGHTEAAYKMGKAYTEGVHRIKDKARALDWYRRAALKGCIAVQYELGKEKYLVKEYKDALTWLQTAVNHGNLPANYYLGVMYYHGWGVIKDFDRSFAYFSNAGTFSGTYYFMGMFYYYGYGKLNKNLNKAFWYFRRYEDVNPDKYAEYYLGLCYKNGYGTEKSLQTAFQNFEKSAKKGIKQSQFELGLCYKNGIGTNCSYRFALEWLLKAANQGYAEAQYEVGEMFFNSRLYSIEDAYPVFTAIQWLQKAADQNHKLAVCRLIDIYYDEQQYTKAGKLISVAINKFSYTNAYFYWAVFCHQGIGGYQMNQQKALELYRSFIKYTPYPDSVKKVKMVENAKQFIYELEHPTLNKLKKILGK